MSEISPPHQMQRKIMPVWSSTCFSQKEEEASPSESTISKENKVFRRKSKRGKPQSSRCFNCEKKGHYARRCLENKAVKLLQQFQAISSVPDDNHNLESMYSEQSDVDEDTVLALQDVTCYSVELDSSSDDSPALRAEQVSTTLVLST